MKKIKENKLDTYAKKVNLNLVKDKDIIPRMPDKKKLKLKL